MDSIRDHGKGAEPRAEQGNDSSLTGLVQHDRAIVSVHPVLKVLVQLMAREAAAEWLAASSGCSSEQEKPDDQGR